LYTSENGLDYRLEGIILDHCNKDMLLFEGKLDDEFLALTRPLGKHYFPSPDPDRFDPGPSINMARSKDALHWKPTENVLVGVRENGFMDERVGGGTPPILTDKGWLILYHGVEATDRVGNYRTFWALLDRKNPEVILAGDTDIPLLEAKDALTESMGDQRYLGNVVFSTGIVAQNTDYIVASGELDLCCRITHIPKTIFELNQ